MTNTIDTAEEYGTKSVPRELILLLRIRIDDIITIRREEQECKFNEDNCQLSFSGK
ncbi:predicted protein [Botrytis cinerea T4]|uniref:Uncharacterized protein n=1 Tax=Botryotinia fuckeliana (strain T4) TaxID=999810 RepID=G2YW59_BOTF4|nr:predicted protein [Botrytis cinerea T4]